MAPRSAPRILGKSGRAMLDALVAGTTDPDVLADLALGKLRAKLPALREALQGRFEAHHAIVIGAILAHLDFLDEQIAGSQKPSRSTWTLRWPPDVPGGLTIRADAAGLGAACSRWPS